MEVVMLRFFGVTEEKIVKEEYGWETAGGTYLAAYKTVLDEFAQSLGDASKHRVVNWFDPDYKTAVIKSNDGIVLARIRVHGEMCLPCEAVVYTTLGEKYQIWLGERLKGVSVKFLPLYPW